MDDDGAWAAAAEARQAAVLCQEGSFRESLPRFAAAQAHLDDLATRGGMLPAGLEQLPLGVQDGWLQAFVGLGDQRPLDNDDIAGAVQRCDRVLTMTDPPIGAQAEAAREHACYQRARFLTLINEYVRALPSAVEVVHVLNGRPSDPTTRKIEMQMRSTIATAYHEIGEPEKAEREFVRLLRVAFVDDDPESVELAVKGIQLVYRRQPARIAHALRGLPDAAEAAAAHGAEARCRMAISVAASGIPGRWEVVDSLAIVEDFLRAARVFDERGEISRQAAAVFCAGDDLSTVAWLHHEYRDRAEATLVEAVRLFRLAADSHGVGVASFALAELLHRGDPDAVRDLDRIADLQDAAVAAFRSVGRAAEEADALLMRAELTGLHVGPTSRFADQCLEAFSAHERGRAARILPTDREFHTASRDGMFLLLGPRIAKFVENHPDDPRSAELVWGLEQLAKARSMQDQMVGRELWPRFLARDAQLRALTKELEQRRFELEAAQREGRNLQVGDVHEAIDGLQRRLRYRLEDVVADVELDLASAPVPGWREVQAVLRPGELYVGLVACGRDLFLRCRLTADSARFDSVVVPELMGILLHDLAFVRFAGLHRRAPHRALTLLGELDPGIDTVLICPDRQLVAVPWHLLDPDGTREFLGERLTIAVVPAAGALWSLRRPPAGARPDGGVPRYLGVSHQAPDLETVDQEIENVRAGYFPTTGRCLPTGDGHRMVDETGHVGLLHVASHALVAGFAFGPRTVTPIALAGMTLTADILLLTGCYLGAFGRADNNELVGVARQLLIATGARAAVVSLALVPQAAGNVFSDLVASALTGQAPGKPWVAPAEPLAIGAAVAWARQTMRGMTKQHARLLLGDLAGRNDNPRRDPWWTPWFVVGDPTTRLGAAS